MLVNVIKHLVLAAAEAVAGKEVKVQAGGDHSLVACLNPLGSAKVRVRGILADVLIEAAVLDVRLKLAR